MDRGTYGALWNNGSIGSMVLLYMLTFGDIWGILMVNVTIYTIHGSYGLWNNDDSSIDSSQNSEV
jgi:hypothetical protein